VFNWVFEGRLTVYLVLAGLAVLCLVAWQQDRRRQQWLTGCWVFVGLAGAYFLLDLFVQTPHKQISRRLHRMAEVVGRSDLDPQAKGSLIFEHISPRFRRHGVSRDQFQQAVTSAIGLVSDLTIWDLQFPSDANPGTEETSVTFKAKPKGAVTGSLAFYLVEARFIRDDDGQWRLGDFEVFNPAVDSHTPLQIPGLP